MSGTLTGLSKHRVEGLTDGIYAVAMTLLVLELKLPPDLHDITSVGLAERLAELIPKAIAWLISFLILAIFWLSHQRAFHFVRAVDAGLLWINVLSLLLASLLPFSSSLVGEHAGLFPAQAFYATNMAGMALVSLLQLRHLLRHPHLCIESGFPDPVRRAARFRCWSLVATAALAIAAIDSRFGTFAFMLMWPLGRIGRRIEGAASPVAPPPSTEHPTA